MSLLELTEDSFSWMNGHMKRNTFSGLLNMLGRKDMSEKDITWPMIASLIDMANSLKDIPFKAETTELKPISESRPIVRDTLPQRLTPEVRPQHLCSCGSPRGKHPQCRECYLKAFTDGKPVNRAISSPQLKEMLNNNVRNPERRDTGYFSDRKPRYDRQALAKKCSCGSPISGKYEKCYACHTSETPVRIVKRQVILDLSSSDAPRFNTCTTENTLKSSAMMEKEPVPEVETMCLVHFVDISAGECSDCVGEKAAQ